ncbi:sigma-70 family RNA polymerase sigma factor [Spirosoma sp. HMF3257]|uniref:RNA polymerase sigma factor n=1 Tax=Spirosoma telluris TaxID=2183553 RepID=A0A327NNA6_9BACT|nr:sigma-70 family RNA polymerase sigma factor [Spirosoma telluris]RAI76820.1 RNA polymerase sigma factor [Spirosoma telluris]
MRPECNSDVLLWNALKQDDQPAFAELYQRYHRILYSYGYKVIPNVALVEDAIQDLFVDLWRLRHSLSLVDSVKFYLFRSLRRKIYQLSEREKRIDTAIASSTATEFARSSEQVMADQEQEDQLTQRLAQLVAQLPQRQLEVVTLRFYQNFKTDEIAAIMGITEKSVRNTLHKALTHLREQAAYLAPLLGLLLLWVLA